MKPKLFFLVTEDWYFVSHRMQLACAAKEAGFDVIVATQIGKHQELIEEAGLILEPLLFARSHTKPWQDLKTVIQIYRLYKKHQPNIVHHVAIKPVLYGSIASFFARTPAVVNALTGLGFVFSSTQKKARLIRRIISPFLRYLLSRANTWLILQNPDDLQTLRKGKIMSHHRVALIRGSGVDISNFKLQKSLETNIPIVMLAARLIWEKGISEFVEAAQLLNGKGIQVRFVLVGAADIENPSAVSEELLSDWDKDGVIEWWGRRDKMADVLSQADIVCLPTSYREGLPKVLIEAAACGKTIVTTDAPGCREIVQHGVNGLLVPVKDSQALADAIETLLMDPDLRKTMGDEGRALVEKEFTIEKVIDETLNLYKTALDKT